MPLILQLSPWIAFLIMLAGISAIVITSELLRKFLKLSGEASRKFVHVSVGALILTAPFLFESGLQPALLAVVFIIANALGLKMDRMKGMHTIERQSFGTVFFPLTFLILIIFYWERNPVILLISMAILSFADPLASSIGHYVRNPRFFILWKDRKSVQGSLGMFTGSFLIIFFGLYLLQLSGNFREMSFIQRILTSFGVALGATIAEGISYRGSDNLSAPLVSALLLDMFIYSDAQNTFFLIIWILISGFIALVSYRMRSLTLGGAAGAMIMGMIVFGIGGIAWMTPMVTFFILSSLLSKTGKQYKISFQEVAQKGSNRDINQVFANGGIALILSVLWYFTHDNIFYLMFLGSLAAATADTWGTEIGAFSRVLPRHIITFNRVPAGTSGAITPVGTFATILGAGVLTLSGCFFQKTEATSVNLSLFSVIVISGILGALIDSLLGATIQAQYRCRSCGKFTEKNRHCDSDDVELIKGYAVIDNDVVNFCCTCSGALFVLLFSILLRF